MRHWKVWMSVAAAAALLAAGPGLAESAFEPNRPTGEAPAQAGEAPNPAHGMEAPPRPDSAAGGDAKTTTSAEEYVVEKGDTLAEIAAEKLGSAEQWKVLARANGIDDPEKLRVGQKLRIPKDRRS